LFLRALTLLLEDVTKLSVAGVSPEEAVCVINWGFFEFTTFEVAAGHIYPPDTP